MRIGMLTDSRHPNLAIMKLARHYLDQGAEVEWYNAARADTYDKVFASKVFDFTDPTPFDPARMEIGGTGWNKKIILPPEIEILRPDYSLYPDFDGNIGFLTRGCRERCKHCDVPGKEGAIAPTNLSVGDLLVTPSRRLVILDNDFMGSPDWHDHLKEIAARKLYVNFSQGLNIRRITDEQVAALVRLKILFRNSHFSRKMVYFAWDRMKDERRVLDGIKRCFANGLKPYQMGFYVLIGFNTTPEEDEYRVLTLKRLGCVPYAMSYNEDDPYQKRFERWVNFRPGFKVTNSFAEYKPSVKGRGARAA